MRIRLWRGRGWSLRLELVPRDLWVGLFWQTRPEVYLRGVRQRTSLYLCLCPALPLVLSWTWGAIRTHGGLR